MQKQFAFAFLALSLAACSAKQEPTNLAEVRKEIEAWIESESYPKTLETQLAEAKAKIEKELRSQKQTKYTVVLDVDETALSNYEYQKRYQFGYSSETWDAWVREEKAPAIAPSLNFYKWLRAKNVDVFFITGRRASAPVLEQDATYRNLKAVGYTDIAGLYLKPKKTERKVTTVEYKSEARCEIQSKGYTLLANVGDQWSDLQGNCLGALTVKLANPMYTVN